MNCEQARQHWHLFHDSEGDAELHLNINEHLQRCPECARWFTEQSILEDAIEQSLKSEVRATPEIWDRIHQRLDPPQPVSSRKWILFGSVGFTLVASLLILACVSLWSSGVPDVASLSVGLHDKLTTGKEIPQFASTSHLAIEDYLKRHVDFPVRCPPREDAGFLARGGGTYLLANNSVAYVLGKVDGEDVSIFILSRDSLDQFPRQRAMLQQAGMHRERSGSRDVVMTQFDQNLVLVVGQVAPKKLERLLRAYGSYHHTS